MGGKVVIGTGAAFVIGGIVCTLIGYFGSYILITGLGLALFAIALVLGLRSRI